MDITDIRNLSIFNQWRSLA